MYTTRDASITILDAANLPKVSQQTATSAAPT